VVGNHLAQHPRLSATATGLAVHIQSLPDGASVTAKALTLRFREGEITIRRALNELETAGYLERRRVPLGGGRFATRTFSYDRPGCPPAPPRPKPDGDRRPPVEPPTPVHRKPTAAAPRPYRPSGPRHHRLSTPQPTCSPACGSPIPAYCSPPAT